MSIRELGKADLVELALIHKANGLPENCFPPILIKPTPESEEIVLDPLFVANSVVETNGIIAMACFLKATLEVFLIIDHKVGTAEQRWQWLQQLTLHARAAAWAKGFDEMTAWIPLELESSFEKRLSDLGFVKSPWQSYTLKLKIGS